MAVNHVSTITEKKFQFIGVNKLFESHALTSLSSQSLLGIQSYRCKQTCYSRTLYLVNLS
ncbi:hypothetical protein AT1219_70117 [Vibrio alginolyticus]